MATNERNTGITSYLAEERSKFESNLNIARKTLDPEAIHQYRLALKRLRAFFNLFEHVTAGKAGRKKLYKPVRVYFKAGGELRDIHVQLELLEQLEAALNQPFDKIREFLFFSEVRSVKKFGRKVNRPVEKALDKSFKTIHRIAGKLSPDKFETGSIDWVKSELAFLREIYPFIYDPEIFHRFRRHQKQSFYMIDFMNKHTSTSLTLERPLGEVKSIARRIGTWHDYHNLYHTVGQINKLYNDSRLKISKECGTLAEYLAMENENLFRQLRDELNDTSLFELKWTPTG